MRAVEQEVRDTVVALDASGLFKTSRDLVRNLSEDGDLSLDNLLVPTGRHVRADRLDESILRIVAEDLFPQLSRGVKVFRIDGREEGAGVREEAFAVNLVEIDGSVSELDGINRRQVVGSTALVEKCHLAVTLEVAHSVGANGLIDRQLLVIGADSMEHEISEPYLPSR